MNDEESGYPSMFVQDSKSPAAFRGETLLFEILHAASVFRKLQEAIMCLEAYEARIVTESFILVQVSLRLCAAWCGKVPDASLRTVL
jgi:hypothetical protein